jgi:hypothetical protein
MDQAIRDSGLEAGEISNERTGIIMGSGGAPRTPSWNPPTSRVEKGRNGSGRSPSQGHVVDGLATLATWFKIKGVNYSISSACATSNHCIGNASRSSRRPTGHHLRGRLRGARLVAVGAVRRDGAHVVEVQRPSGRRLARL